jgi:ferric iron reductase protein FhuF
MNHRPPSVVLPEEWTYLQRNMRVTITRSEETDYSITVKDLLDEDLCAAYLDRISNVLGSPSRMVTASSFSKRYAYLVINPGLYMMTKCNKSLDVSIHNCHVESLYHNDTWRPHIRYTLAHATEPGAGSRDEWRDQLIQTMFADHLAVLWRVISKVAKVPIAILWENTAVYLYHLYEKTLAAEVDEQGRARLLEDFDYLRSGASGSLFGERKNPLTTYYGPKYTTPASDHPIRFRKTCCHYYELADAGEYCTNCPKVMPAGSNF